MKGTGFSPYIEPYKNNCDFSPGLKGTGFSPYIKHQKTTGALAPEELPAAQQELLPSFHIHF
jgi:hypothetical protein